MSTPQLFERIAERMPSAPPSEQFRMAMLVCHAAESDVDALDDHWLDQTMQAISMKLALHQDQYSATAEELDTLADTEPCKFNPQHLWMLVRAIKVQSQLLNFYLGPQMVVDELASAQ